MFAKFAFFEKKNCVLKYLCYGLYFKNSKYGCILRLSSDKRKYLNILVRTLKNKLVYKGTYDKMSSKFEMVF